MMDPIISVANCFANEQVPSNYGYLSGYRRPNSISDQIDIFRGHWPTLNPDLAIRYARDVLPNIQFPGLVEGPFVVVRPGFFSNIYGEELEEVMQALSRARGGKFYNFRKDAPDSPKPSSAI